MWKKFEKLAQANVDHYNRRPMLHTASAVALMVGGMWLIQRMARRSVDPHRKDRYLK